MNNFFAYFNEDIGMVFQAFMDAIGSCFNFLNYLFNFPMRMEIIKEHVPGFTTGDWVMLLNNFHTHWKIKQIIQKIKA